MWEGRYGCCGSHVGYKREESGVEFRVESSYNASLEDASAASSGVYTNL